MLYLINAIKILCTLAIVGYLAATTLLFVFQRHFLYVPTPAYSHQFPIESMEIEDDRVDVLIANPGRDKAILYFPGNAEAVALTGPIIKEALSEYSVYMMNYPGYATSAGEPSEKALYTAAEALFDRVNPRHTNVFVLGRSLGTGVATYVASKREVEKLALVTPFDSITNIAKKRFTFFPTSVLLKDHYDSLGRVKSIRAKTLILIAELDRVIPFENSDVLVKAFPVTQLQTHVLKGAGHDGLSENPEYYLLLRKFFEQE